VKQREGELAIKGAERRGGTHTGGKKRIERSIGKGVLNGEKSEPGGGEGPKDERWKLNK